MLHPSPLRELSTRNSTDPTIALLDAWAVVADVLTYYQERLTNESYLRTTQDEKVLRELGALVGFQPRPGVSATVYLAYTLDKDAAPVVILQGAKAQTIPGPSEQMQTFETDEKLDARMEWNDLRPRAGRPPIRSIEEAGKCQTITLAGFNSNVRPGDRLLFAISASLTKYVVREVRTVEVNALAGRLELTLKSQGIDFDLKGDGQEFEAEVEPAKGNGEKPTTIQSLVTPISQQQERQPATGRMLRRAAEENDLNLVRHLVNGISNSIFSAWARVPVDGKPAVLKGAFVFRVVASLFGAAAPPLGESHGKEIQWELAEEDKSPSVLHLDANYEAVAAGGYIIHNIKGGEPSSAWRLRRIRKAATVGRHGYLLSSRVTRIEVEQPDGIDVEERLTNFDHLRSVVVLAGSEPVQLAPDPITEPIEGNLITLDGLYPELPTGRRIIITGERVDILDAGKNALPGIRGGELAMISAVQHGPDKSIPGDTPHTTISLATSLAYQYKRETVHIYGNVVKASHGESTTEVLGSGNAGIRQQTFVLKRPPITFTSAPTLSGVKSSEAARVDGARYERFNSLLDAEPSTRAYELEVDETGRATVRFGDGVHGARLPSGQQNVRATYRVGVGSTGNVRAEQISLLTTRPLGVSSVINPLSAGGGADGDSPERIRQGVPLAALALSPLSRLVSVEDYAAFARRFAGIGHADAVKLTDGSQQLVHVTVTGANDAHLDADSDLMVNLRNAFETFSDPSFAVEISIRELKALVIEASIGVNSGVDWDVLEPLIRQRTPECVRVRSAEARPAGVPFGSHPPHTDYERCRLGRRRSIWRNSRKRRS